MQTKKEIFDKVIKRLQENLQSIIEQINVVNNAANDAPGRNESRYDSTKEEMSYLSNSLSKKAQNMQSDINRLIDFALPSKTDHVLLGSLVEISMNNDDGQLIFLLPFGGGCKINACNTSVTTVSRQAPLCLALLGKRVGESILFNGRQILIKKIR